MSMLLQCPSPKVGCWLVVLKGKVLQNHPGRGTKRQGTKRGVLFPSEADRVFRLPSQVREDQNPRGKKVIGPERKSSLDRKKQKTLPSGRR